jgi:WD40 repeat protein
VPGRDAFVVAGVWAGPLRLCDLAAGGNVQTFPGVPQDIHSICFASGGKLVAAASSDGKVYLWDVEAEPVALLEPVRDPVTQAFPSCPWLAPRRRGTIASS